MLLRGLETDENRSKEAGRFSIQVHETAIENKVTSDHFTPTTSHTDYPEDYRSKQSK